MKSLMLSLVVVLCLLITMTFFEPFHSEDAAHVNSHSSSDKSIIGNAFKQDAALIRNTYESQLYTLSAFKSGHYGLRMYRQSLDDKYAAAIWSDMARVASRLNYFANEVNTSAQITAYSAKRINNYLVDASERSVLRYQVTKAIPEYLYLGVDLLGSMARANEYGLKHQQDAKLREVIGRYDFTNYATNQEMIKAWAAQLANQVYWLKQLGEQDVTEEFIEAFRETYPDHQDQQLSEQQLINKVYGLTHIIFAASAYYQFPINETDFQWIYDYYRNNIDMIIERTKEDVIAEVGINFLLAGLADDPVVLQTQSVIQKSLDREHGLVPSVDGEFDLKKGEHRNVLAIMLLDWQGVHQAPTVNAQPDLFKSVPYGLVNK
ncbi:DUF3541 domain-containing protein [Psychromonas sp. B3M02]|uniref:DUF3541 domain-containing protein n=1 Tax=Psychromonas sp. B3M02 TaxID=2267226 RepID=UPI000DE9869B|nr:DUF3541 domain-containing protein [Psychromonas sp. B3M02]RBW47003.1 DUF3541 domain-containing protein [Psychromonas sp. B3M02]